MYLTVFVKTYLQVTQDSPRSRKSLDHLPGGEIGSSRIHVTPASPAGCPLNTEPASNVQQLSKVPIDTFKINVISHSKPV